MQQTPRAPSGRSPRPPSSRPRSQSAPGCLAGARAGARRGRRRAHRCGRGWSSRCWRWHAASSTHAASRPTLGGACARARRLRCSRRSLRGSHGCGRRCAARRRAARRCWPTRSSVRSAPAALRAARAGQRRLPRQSGSRQPASATKRLLPGAPRALLRARSACSSSGSAWPRADGNPLAVCWAQPQLSKYCVQEGARVLRPACAHRRRARAPLSFPSAARVSPRPGTCSRSVPRSARPGRSQHANRKCRVYSHSVDGAPCRGRCPGTRRRPRGLSRTRSATRSRGRRRA